MGYGVMRSVREWMIDGRCPSGALLTIERHRSPLTRSPFSWMNQPARSISSRFSITAAIALPRSYAVGAGSGQGVDRLLTRCAIDHPEERP